MKNSIAKMEAFHKQLTLGNVTTNAIKVYKSLLENPQTIHSMRPNLGMAHQSLTATLSHLEDMGWVYKDSTTKVKGNSFTLYKAEISSHNAMLRAQAMQEHKYNEWIKRGKKNGWIKDDQAKEIENEQMFDFAYDYCEAILGGCHLSPKDYFHTTYGDNK